MTKVSIVMTIQNGARFLEETMQSIVNQTYKDFELIVIDSCSTDETPDIVKKFMNDHENIIYQRSDRHIPISTGLNQGFSIARGEYWTKADCDNIYYPGAIGEMVAFLDAHPDVGFVYYDMERIDANGQVIGYSRVAPADELIYHNYIGNCLLYRAELARQVGPYSEDIVICDYDYWFRFYQVAKMQAVNTCNFQYRIHDNNLSGINDRQDVMERNQLRKKYYHQFIKTRRQAALYYAHTRSRDIYSKWRQLYLIPVLFYSPCVFYSVVWKRVIPES